MRSVTTNPHLPPLLHPFTSQCSDYVIMLIYKVMKGIQQPCTMQFRHIGHSQMTLNTRVPTCSCPIAALHRFTSLNSYFAVKRSRASLSDTQVRPNIIIGSAFTAPTSSHFLCQAEHFPVFFTDKLFPLIGVSLLTPDCQFPNLNLCFDIN